MTVMVVLAHNGSDLAASNARVIAAAQQLGEPVIALLAGDVSVECRRRAACYVGLTALWVAEHDVYHHCLPEPMAALIVDCIESASLSGVVMAASCFGKNILPRVAGLLGVSMANDIAVIDAPGRYQRYQYAGNILTHIQQTDQPQLLTIRSSSFTPVDCSDEPVAEKILHFVASTSQAEWVSAEERDVDQPSLDGSDCVFAAGRGLGSAENIARMQRVAAHYTAAVAATRALVDAGLAPNEQQVGQTGKAVAPALYIACGISGAVQHVAGMKDSGVIVAINNDPEADIFAVADYGLVADVNEVLAQWEQSLIALT